MGWCGMLESKSISCATIWCYKGKEKRRKRESISAIKLQLVHTFVEKIVIKLRIFIRWSFLILLIFADQIVHVGFSFSELHLIHALGSVPMQESFATKHASKLLADTTKELLNRCRVADECRWHLQSLRWNVTDGCLNIIRYPFNEVARILVLYRQHLLINFLHRHLSTKDSGNSQIASMSRITCCHHIFRIEHLLCQLRHGQATILLWATRDKRCKSGHEEVQTWKGHHVRCQLTKIGVELTWKAETCRDARHRERDEMIQVAICWRRQFERTKANVVERLIVNAECSIGVLHQLMYRQGRIVRFDDSVGDFRRWNDRERVHDTIGILFANFRDEQCAEPTSGAA